MLNIAADHINAVEAKESAERKTNQEHTARLQQIGRLQQVIADAERRKDAPIFSNDDAATSYQNMKQRVEAMGREYERNMWSARQSARPYPLDISSEQALCFFFGDTIIEKLPALAAKICSRDGRGQVVDEEKRAAVIAECNATIADAREKLAAMGAIS